MNGFISASTNMRSFRSGLLAGLAVSVATAVGAETLNFPSNATLQFEEVNALDSYAVPIGIWSDGVMPIENAEGKLTKQAWRIDAQALTTLQLLRPLREQLRNDRYRIIFECQTEACGGFDFRFETVALPPPEMQINIGDFRFLSARRFGDDGPEYITLFLSRTAQAGYVQVIHVGSASEDTLPVSAASGPALRAAEEQGDISLRAQLDDVGRSVLADLSFETGSSRLSDSRFLSLEVLADYLNEFPDRNVALVGHTDASGSLDANIALSKRRAGAVLERLVTEYGVRRAQLAAEGMGYLSPLATNQTEDGREENRRVEVIITSMVE
ncbi:OmpA family protein [Yoonia maritima]|uniref:OmpA family protein n=1 Tax=Yoonia maritima TaxID=1435347 RepID=UPI001EF8E82F|nr:OmpA family protein [Yoonia maritima]